MILQISFRADVLFIYHDARMTITFCVMWPILQRIALVYFFVALIETLTTKLRPTVLEPGHISIFSAYRWQW